MTSQLRLFVDAKVNVIYLNISKQILRYHSENIHVHVANNFDHQFLRILH